MAETVLSPATLARIDRDLDQLILPAPEEIRSLVSETRRLCGETMRLTAVLCAIASEIEHATKGPR